MLIMQFSEMQFSEMQFNGAFSLSKILIRKQKSNFLSNLVVTFLI